MASVEDYLEYSKHDLAHYRFALKQNYDGYLKDPRYKAGVWTPLFTDSTHYYFNQLHRSDHVRPYDAGLNHVSGGHIPGANATVDRCADRTLNPHQCGIHAAQHATGHVSKAKSIHYSQGYYN